MEKNWRKLKIHERADYEVIARGEKLEKIEDP